MSEGFTCDGRAPGLDLDGAMVDLTGLGVEPLSMDGMLSVVVVMTEMGVSPGLSSLLIHLGRDAMRVLVRRAEHVSLTIVAQALLVVARDVRKDSSVRQRRHVFPDVWRT